ncbi:putative bacteriocin export ABC transporter [Dethiothermospora halolimnae]|uniref:putative bacteriocin export ABC transporter n=1 Tax=Dethiothermospora halolimnae TaxID=3114390 RepID=UPI003CCB9B25
MELLKLEDITKSFGKVTVLSDINISVKEGEMIAIVGASGSGKTSLLNIIGLISRKDEGNLYIYNHKNPQINSKKAMLLRRNKIGYLFQNYGLVDDETVLWNLKLALTYKKLNKREKNKRINNLISDFGFTNLKKKKIYQLSGGEQQRVAIMRLILQESDLILADEPTGSLDEQNRDLVISLLKKLNKQGKTVIIVTHDNYVASQCRRTINLDAYKLKG